MNFPTPKRVFESHPVVAGAIVLCLVTMGVLVIPSSAHACYSDIYTTHILGWDESTRTFVVERRRTFACAGCTCGTQERELRLANLSRGETVTAQLSFDDLCTGSFSVIPTVAPEQDPDDEDKTLARRFETARRKWKSARPVVERALTASLGEGVRRERFSLAEEDLLSLTVSLKGRPLTSDQLGRCKSPTRPSDRALVDEMCYATGEEPGERTVAIERWTYPVPAKAGDKPNRSTIASFTWTPSCSEQTCDELHVYWATDGSAVAVVAGAVVAERDTDPEHGPKMQPAEVVAVDLKTKAVLRDRLTIAKKPPPEP